MFDNIGKKIKILAWIIFVLGIIGSVIWGIITSLNLSGIENVNLFAAIIIGAAVMAVGVIASWVSVVLLYGFGESIDKVCSNCETHLEWE